MNEPVTKCTECNTEDNCRDVVVDQIDYIVTAKERICNNCDHLMDYWAYGYWMN